MERYNLYVAWFSVLGGLATGAIQGLFFHQEQWLGGYSSWERRLTRLGHISFFGLAFINFLFVFSVWYFKITNPIMLPSILFMCGAITMPMCCYLAAFWKGFRHFFFIPVTCLLIGTIAFVFLNIL